MVDLPFSLLDEGPFRRAFFSFKKNGDGSVVIVQRCSPAVLSRLFSAQQALEEAIASLEGNDVGALSEIDVALAKVEASLIEIELEAFFADPCYTRWLQTSQ